MISASTIITRDTAPGSGPLRLEESEAEGTDYYTAAASVTSKHAKHANTNQV